MKDGKMVIYTLAVKEINVQHTSENLKKVVLKELEAYGIYTKNIYTITSDNGANLVKAVDLIEDQQREDEIEHLEEDISTIDDLMEVISNVEWDQNDKIMSMYKFYHGVFFLICNTSEC